MTTGRTPVHVPCETWEAKDTRRFTTHRDLRRLLVIEHPWEPSVGGGYGEWETAVPPPKGWQPGRPLFVSFYQSDNYSGTWQESAWMGSQAFIGHRFKQLLVNGEVVWEQDVADDELAGSAYSDPYCTVEVTDQVRDRIVLTFRVTDRVASTTELPGDAYRRFSWSAHDPDVARKNFQTSVYFGDVFLTERNAVVRPEEQAAASPPKQRTRPSLPEPGVPLNLVGPARLPALGYPVRCGVPLPKGCVAPGTSVGLLDPKGDSLPVATTEISSWPDGSVRWLLCEFVATRKGRYRLIPGAEPQSPCSPVRIRTHNKRTTVTNGALSLRIGRRAGHGVFDGVLCRAGIDLGPMALSIKLNRVGWRDHFTARRRRVEVEYSNPVCAVIRVEGDMLDRERARFGPWRARVHVWAGLPYVVVEWRLVNESDQAMAMLLDWSARVSLPDRCGANVDFGPFTPGYDPDDIGVKAMGHYGEIKEPRALPLHADSELSCRQEHADQARLYRNTSWVATADRAAGYVNMQHPKGGVVGAMRWFAEEFPKGIVVRPDELSLATLPESEDAIGWPHDRPFVRMGRGEAKRQTFALWLHDGTLPPSEAERFNQCVQDSPRLFNYAWFLKSDALETGPARTNAKLKAWAEQITPVVERTGIDAPRLGHREYWDTCWSNDYRGRVHLGLLQYVETGDPRWFRYFDAAATHNRDVDVVHFCPEHPDWVGATHAYGEDHTACGIMGNIGLNCDSLLDHYLLTGDPDSLEAAAGQAEHILTCPPLSRSARAVGWPLSQLVRWYDQTKDKRFLRKAQEFVRAARTYVEPRRGIFSQIHGCWNYHGTVPFMTGYLAFGLIRYHQLTDDREALTLLRKLADGLFAESYVGDGRFRYSPFPENNRSLAGCRAWNGLVGGLVGYLYCVTKDPRYAEWTQECYEAIVGEADDMQVTMDMLQIAGWMLRVVARR